jgi:predicted transcriptional regulator
MMNELEDRTNYLLMFFKALADQKRLQIVGLLAQQDYSVEELAAILDLSSPTISHHLGRLAEAGLVKASADRHYHVYSLDVEALAEMAQQILSKDALQLATEDLDLDAYDRKVLRDYTDPETGRLKSIPRQKKKRDAVLRYLVAQFEPDRRYAEREVNEMICRTHDDYATLRRELVDAGLLARERDSYWLVAQA